MAHPSDLMVGLDIGTSSVKAALVDSGGNLRYVARRPTPVRTGRRGDATHPPEGLLGAAEAAVADCVAVSGRRRVTAIGVASMAEAGTFIDAHDRPLTDIIAWFDTRSSGQAAALEAEFGAAKLYGTTGLRPVGKYTLPRILWLTRNRRASLRMARRWAGVAELAALRLTGSLATNASLACRTLAFDISKRRWDPELLGFAGLTVEQMPEVVPFGRAAAGLTTGAATRLGLPAGLPVVVAGHDHVVGGFGAGVVRPGMALDSMGSAEACLMVAERPRTDERLRLGGFSVGCHAVDDAAYVLAGLQASGALVDWFVDVVLGSAGDGGVSGGRVPGSASGGGAAAGNLSGAGSPDSASVELPAAGERRYAAFEALLARAPDAPGPIVTLPYLRGRTAPRPDRHAGLSIVGLGAADDLAVLAQGIVDGAACAVRWIFDELEQAAGARIRTTRLIGGGARIERWRAAKACLSRVPLELVDVEEATALGAALAAGLAGGVYGSVGEAVACAAPAHRIPRLAAAARRYETYYRTRFLPIATGMPDVP